MSSKIEQEILTATGLKLRGNDRAKQLDQIAEAVNKLPDEDWGKLSNAAQKWFNAASQAIDKEQPIAEFADATDDKPAKPAKETAPASEPKESTVATRKAASGKKPANGKSHPAPAKKAPAKAAAPAKKAARKGAVAGGGLPKQVARLVMKNPAITAEEVTKRLSAKGITGSKFTIGTWTSNMRWIMRMLQEEGHLRGVKID